MSPGLWRRKSSRRLISCLSFYSLSQGSHVGPFCPLATPFDSAAGSQKMDELGGGAICHTSPLTKSTNPSNHLRLRGLIPRRRQHLYVQSHRRRQRYDVWRRIVRLVRSTPSTGKQIWIMQASQGLSTARARLYWGTQQPERKDQTGMQSRESTASWKRSMPPRQIDLQSES